MRRACLVAGLITFLAFVPSLRNGFVDWDDDHNFVNNPNYRGLGADNLRWMFTTFHAGPYQPLSWMTLGLDYCLWGMRPAGYHFTSVLLHAVAAGLLAGVAIRLRERSVVSDQRSAGAAVARGGHAVGTVAFGVFVGLVWGLHPLRVEAATWITERREVLSGVLALLAITIRLRGGRWWVVALIALAAMLAKGTAVVLAGALILIDLYCDGLTAANAARAMRRHAAVIVAAVAVGVVAIAGQRATSTIVRYQLLELRDRLELFGYSLTFYAWKTVWPFGLAPLYEAPRDRAVLAPVAWGCAAVMIALLAVAWMLRRRAAAPLLLVVTYVGLVLPIGGLMQVGPQIAADRYSYQPGWALSLMIGAVVFWLLEWLKARRAVWMILTAVVAVGLAVRTVQQEAVWHDTRSLFTHQLALYPDTGIAHRNLGLDFASHSRGPSDDAQAEAHFRACIERLPHFVDAILDLADLLRRTGRAAEASEWYKRAVKNDSANRAGIFGLADSLWNAGRRTQSLAAFGMLVKAEPNSEVSHVLFARALAAAGQAADARREFEAAVRVAPESVEALAGLATLLSTNPDDSVRDGRLAVELAHQAMRLSRPVESRITAMTAAAYAESGNFERAIELMQDAVRSAPAEHVTELTQRLARLQRHEPIRLQPEYP